MTRVEPRSLLVPIAGSHWPVKNCDARALTFWCPRLDPGARSVRIRRAANNLHPAPAFHRHPLDVHGAPPDQRSGETPPVPRGPRRHPSGSEALAQCNTPAPAEACPDSHRDPAHDSKAQTHRHSSANSPPGRLSPPGLASAGHRRLHQHPRRTRDERNAR